MPIIATDPTEPQYRPPERALATIVPPEPEDSLLTSQQRAKVELYAEEVREITRHTTSTALTTSAEANSISELLARGKVAVKELENVRRAAVDPLNAKVKAVNAVFRPLTDALESFEQRAKRLLLAYQQAERARVQREAEESRRRMEEAAQREAEALAKAEQAKTAQERQDALAAAEQASQEQATAIIEAPMPAPRARRTDTGTAGLTERWTFEVVDESKVPRQYLAVDRQSIRKAVSAGVRDIPGVSIHLEEGIAVRVG